MNWQDILTIIVPLGAFLGWIYSRIDKRFEEICFRTDKRFDEFSSRMDKKFEENKNDIKEIKDDLKDIRADLVILNTRVAIIESKLSDISTNVTYLMWHNQTLPQKEAKEE